MINSDTPTLTDAAGNIEVAVTVSADAGTNISAMAGRYVTLTALDGNVFVSCGVAMSGAGVTAPTASGAGVGTPILSGQSHDFLVPPLVGGTNKNVYLRTIGSASCRLLVTRNSR